MSAEILVTCPYCQRRGFTVRGLTAHWCKALGSRRLSLADRKAAAAQAAQSSISPTSPVCMAKPNTILALATFTAPELRADKAQLVLLQKGVIEQVHVMRRLRGEEAMRGLLVGLTLLRIKASLPGGQFTGWLKEHITVFKDRYCRYLMQLALVFVERTKASKPELLALPGEQVELSLDGKEGAQRKLFEKAAKFIGEHSITELLEKHGLKEKKKLGGPRESADAEPEAPATPEQLAARARTDLADWITQGRQLLLQENIAQHLSPQEVRAFAESYDALRTEWRKGNKKTLAD